MKLAVSLYIVGILRACIGIGRAAYTCTGQHQCRTRRILQPQSSERQVSYQTTLLYLYEFQVAAQFAIVTARL